MAINDSFKSKVRDLAAAARDNARIAASEDKPAFESLAGMLESWDRAPGGAAPLRDFLTSVGEGVVRAQEELDRRSIEYSKPANDKWEALVPTLYRIPKVEAEFHFAMERSSSSGFNVIVASRKTASNELFENRVRFEVVAAPPPAAPSAEAVRAMQANSRAASRPEFLSRGGLEEPRGSADFEAALASASGGATAGEGDLAAVQRGLETLAEARRGHGARVAKWLLSPRTHHRMAVRVEAGPTMPSGYVVIGLMPAASRARGRAAKADWFDTRRRRATLVAALFLDPANPVESVRTFDYRKGVPAAMDESAALIAAALETLSNRQARPT